MNYIEKLKRLSEWINARIAHACDHAKYKNAAYGSASNYGLSMPCVNRDGPFPSFEQYLKCLEQQPDPWIPQQDGSKRMETETDVWVSKPNFMMCIPKQITRT
jgi:hypothetical protein